MKVVAKELSTTSFKPFEVTLKVESQAEAYALFQLGNYNDTVVTRMKELVTGIDEKVLASTLVDMYDALVAIPSFNRTRSS